MLEYLLWILQQMSGKPKGKTEKKNGKLLIVNCHSQNLLTVSGLNTDCRISLVFFFFFFFSKCQEDSLSCFLLLESTEDF